MPTLIASHYQAAVDRLASKFADVPELLSILEVFSGQIQALETALWDLLTKRWIDSGEGAQLDVIGRVVLQPRGASTDPVYRLQLKARIKSLLSSGGPEEILSIFRLLHAGDLRLEEDYPAGFRLHLEGVEALSNLDVLLTYLREARAEGVAANLRVLSGAEADAFSFAGPTVQLDGSYGIGDVDLSTIQPIPSDFPGQGSVVIAAGTPSEEVVAYLSRDTWTFHLAPGGLANAQNGSEAVTLLGIAGKGFGDYYNGATGGALAGEWEA